MDSGDRYGVGGGRQPSFWHEVGPEPLAARTVGQLFDWAAEEWGDREALVSVYESVRWTYRQVADKVDRLCAGLLSLGLSRGDVVAVWSYNSTHIYLMCLAAAKAGLVLAKVDPKSEPAELLDCLLKVGARCLVAVQTAGESRDRYGVLRGLAPELGACSPGRLTARSLPRLETVVFAGADPDVTPPGTYSMNDILNRTTEGSFKVEELINVIDPEDGYAIHFTSGTTGFSKAALLAHFGSVNNSYLMGLDLGLHNKHHRMCLHNQICHVMASSVILLSLHFGVTLVLPSPYFQAEKSVKTILEERCTSFFSTPVMCIDMIAACVQLGVSLDQVELCLIGGAPCPAQVAEQALDVMKVQQIYMGYGMTECGIAFMSKKGDCREQMTNTVGHVTSHTQVKVVDTADKMVPMGSIGEIWTRSHGTMLGYWGDEEKTRDVITPLGWVRTGDLGVLQADGYGRIVGRIKDTIIRGCDKIFPIEIEDFFLTHPDVLEVQAFGVPDVRLGEEMAVCIRPKKGKLVTEDMMIDYCKGKLSEFRVPKYVRILADFPRNIGQKVKKYKLKEMLMLELCLQDVAEGPVHSLENA